MNEKCLMSTMNVVYYGLQPARQHLIAKLCSACTAIAHSSNTVATRSILSNKSEGGMKKNANWCSEYGKRGRPAAAGRTSEGAPERARGWRDKSGVAYPDKTSGKDTDAAS